MARKDHHESAFDGGTQTKLLIYKSYVQAWLQVFLHTDRFEGKPLQFFDLFAGPGQDSVGAPGSPLILLEELERNRDLIQMKRRDIRIFFNDYDEAKAATLRTLCDSRGFTWRPEVLELDFADAYGGCRRVIGQGPSLVFLDQFGVKFVTRNLFAEIAARPQTDLLFFFASSHQRRFNDELSTELNVPADVPYTHAHRAVADHYREWAPAGYFVGHFSIMKGSNVYGLIFGSGHWLGMFKFLQVAWTLDDLTGEANFPIEADCAQGDFLLGGFKKTKLELMEEDLAARILRREFTTDGQVALHCVTGGILPSKIAPKVYAKLKADGVLGHDRHHQPRTGEDSIREPRDLVFR